MVFNLPDHIRDRVNKVRAYEDKTRRAFAGLSDADLAISAEFWMQHCQAPKAIEPDTVVYDSTFWHAIVPEMIARLKR